MDAAALGPEVEESTGSGRSTRGASPVLAGAWSRVKAPFTKERPADDAEPSGQEPSKSRTKLIVAAVGAVALLAGGIGIGAAASDPTASDEFVALASTKADVESDYEALQADYDAMSSGLEDREAALQEREDAVKEAEGALKEREDGIKEAEGAVKKREEAVSGAEQKKAENTIQEGTWTVGVDIAPGTYRSTGDVGSRCYWAILASGTNGDDIIANDIPGGGRPSVTLSEGQDFETARCGTWQLQ
ncbi:hypothetical protein [Kocuria dechangensis]|nr:hypothetical protein [Kocuria dechangensis]